MNYEFLPARPEDCPQVLGLIQERIRWMRERNLRQWESVDYWSFFPESYYEAAIAEERLYVVKEAGQEKVLCAGVLSFQDPDWSDGAPAVYLHNFASDRNAPGVGGFFLTRAEDYARDHGKQLFRLDCIETNLGLNQYYENRGFQAVGRIEKSGYTGIKREKSLALPGEGAAPSGRG